MRTELFRSRLWALPIAVITIAVFAMVVRADFVLWDDTLLITSNPVIRGLTLQNIGRAFSTYDPELYIPLTFLSYQAEYALVQLQPWIYHLTNLLLHAANATLVGLLMYALTRHKGAALVAGTVFGIHPLQTEAVAWASSRKDLLCTLFFLLSLLQYLRYRERGDRWTYYGSLLLFLLSLFSKVTSVTLPLVLLLLDWLERRPWDRRQIIEKVPFVLLSVLFGVVALFGKRVMADLVTPLDLALVAGKSTLFYLQKFLLPFHLTIVYPLTGDIALDRWDLLLAWVGVAVLCAAAAGALRISRVPLFAAAWYCLTLAPTFTNIAKGNEVYFASDRYAYIPLIGLLTLLAVSGIALERRLPSLRNALYGGCGLWIAGLSLLSWWQAATWRDSLTLLEHAVRVSPSSFAAHINLAVAYRHVWLLEQATHVLLQAKELQDTNQVYQGLAAVEYRKGNYGETIRLLTVAEGMPKRQADANIPYGLGLAYMKQGNLGQAVAEYRKALTIEPHHSGAQNNLASVLLELGDFAGAQREFRSLVEQDPTFSIGHYNLGLIEEELGNVADAVASYERARATASHEEFNVVSRLGPAYARLGRNDDAVAMLRIALRMNTSDAAFLQEALAALQTILEREPQHPGARLLLGEMVERGLFRAR